MRSKKDLFIGATVILLITGNGKPWIHGSATAAPHPSVAAAPSDSPWMKAWGAIAAGDTRNATRYASLMLKQNTDHKVWFYGNVIDEANQILGLAALREGRLGAARQYLLAAGRTPGSPQLDSFGPKMVLAQQLLQHGEKQVVIQYLDEVARFWAFTPEEQLRKYEKRKPGFAAVVKQMDRQNQEQINRWKAEIRAGKKPQLLDSKWK